jgi:DNA-binding LytR/AlgR family response regulator
LAIKHAKLKRPQLILADINLADGSNGIEAVNEILGESDVPVIFVTAYPERLLTGSRPEPAFVISKPFKHEEVQAVVGQALFFDLKARSGLPGEVMASELVAGRMGDHI